MRDFLSKTLETRRKCQNIFQVLKEKNCNPQILYLVKLSFKKEKKLSDKEKLGEFVSSGLKELAKGSSSNTKDIVLVF